MQIKSETTNSIKLLLSFLFYSRCIVSPVARISSDFDEDGLRKSGEIKLICLNRLGMNTKCALLELPRRKEVHIDNASNIPSKAIVNSTLFLYNFLRISIFFIPVQFYHYYSGMFNFPIKIVCYHTSFVYKFEAYSKCHTIQRVIEKTCYSYVSLRFLTALADFPGIRQIFFFLQCVCFKVCHTLFIFYITTLDNFHKINYSYAFEMHKFGRYKI